ncbi:unnamed protein product [Amoebophrya sp. A25]|nr:unnamed protein product [Amoebophrya sp. A25]|eukprot:GSA25T00026022001.1
MPSHVSSSLPQGPGDLLAHETFTRLCEVEKRLSFSENARREAELQLRETRIQAEQERGSLQAELRTLRHALQYNKNEKTLTVGDLEDRLNDLERRNELLAKQKAALEDEAAEYLARLEVSEEERARIDKERDGIESEFNELWGGRMRQIKFLQEEKEYLQSKIVSLEDARDKSLVTQSLEVENIRAECEEKAESVRHECESRISNEVDKVRSQYAEKIERMESKVLRLAKAEAEQDTELLQMRSALIDINKLHAEAVDESAALRLEMEEQKERHVAAVDTLKEEYAEILKNRASRYLQDMDVLSVMQDRLVHGLTSERLDGDCKLLEIRDTVVAEKAAIAEKTEALEQHALALEARERKELRELNSVVGDLTRLLRYTSDGIAILNSCASDSAACDILGDTMESNAFEEAEDEDRSNLVERLRCNLVPKLEEKVKNLLATAVGSISLKGDVAEAQWASSSTSDAVLGALENYTKEDTEQHQLEMAYARECVDELEDANMDLAQENFRLTLDLNAAQRKIDLFEVLAGGSSSASSASSDDADVVAPADEDVGKVVGGTAEQADETELFLPGKVGEGMDAEATSSTLKTTSSAGNGMSNFSNTTSTLKSAASSCRGMIKTSKGVEDNRDVDEDEFRSTTTTSATSHLQRSSQGATMFDDLKSKANTATVPTTTAAGKKSASIYPRASPEDGSVSTTVDEGGATSFSGLFAARKKLLDDFSFTSASSRAVR